LPELHQALRSGRLRIAVSTTILLEYEEVICRYADRARWLDVARMLELLTALHGNVLSVNPSFRFRIISGDEDDNAFADCAIAAEADWIVTSDHHFDVLIHSGYKPQPITPEEFIRRFLTFLPE
jgi:putative PIN family toxin of toxin-antitoxin system